MLILLVPVIIPLCLVAGILFLCLRKYWWGLAIILATIAVNYFTQTFPFHLSGGSTVEPRDHSAMHQSQHCRFKVLTYNLGLNNLYLRHQTDSLRLIEEFLVSEDADIILFPESRMVKYPQLRLFLGQQYPYSIDQQLDIDARYIETFVYSRYPVSNVQIWGDYIYSLDLALPTDTVRLVACHLQSNQWHSDLNGGEGFFSNLDKGFEQRKEQAKCIVDSLHGQRGPLLVCGDLNDISGSATLNILQDNLGLADAWWKAGCGYGATFTGKHLYLRLDHILYSDDSIEILNTYIPDAAFSDHLPLVAEFRLRR